MKLRFWKDIVVAFFWAAFFHFVFSKLRWKRIKKFGLVALGRIGGVLILIAIGLIAFMAIITLDTTVVGLISLIVALMLIQASDLGITSKITTKSARKKVYSKVLERLAKSNILPVSR